MYISNPHFNWLVKDAENAVQLLMKYVPKGPSNECQIAENLQEVMTWIKLGQHAENSVIIDRQLLVNLVHLANLSRISGELEDNIWTNSVLVQAKLLLNTKVKEKQKSFQVGDEVRVIDLRDEETAVERAKIIGIQTNGYVILSCGFTVAQKCLRHLSS